MNQGQGQGLRGTVINAGIAPNKVNSKWFSLTGFPRKNPQLLDNSLTLQFSQFQKTDHFATCFQGSSIINNRTTAVSVWLMFLDHPVHITALHNPNTVKQRKVPGIVVQN